MVYAELTPIVKEHSSSSTTLINIEDINNRSVSTISEILRNVSGLAVSRGGVRGSQPKLESGESNQLLV